MSTPGAATGDRPARHPTWPEEVVSDGDAPGGEVAADAQPDVGDPVLHPRAVEEGRERRPAFDESSEGSFALVLYRPEQVSELLEHGGGDRVLEPATQE